MKIAAYLCQSSLYLLHDEQCEIRESACGFVSALQIEQKVSKLQHNVATKVRTKFSVECARIIPLVKFNIKLFSISWCRAFVPHLEQSFAFE